jgi:hypothetical protein
MRLKMDSTRQSESNRVRFVAHVHVHCSLKPTCFWRSYGHPCLPSAQSPYYIANWSMLMRGSRAAELGKVTFQSRHPLPMFLRLDGTATATGRCENMIYELKRLTTWIHC